MVFLDVIYKSLTKYFFVGCMSYYYGKKFNKTKQDLLFVGQNPLALGVEDFVQMQVQQLKKHI